MKGSRGASDLPRELTAAGCQELARACTAALKGTELFSVPDMHTVQAIQRITQGHACYFVFVFFLCLRVWCRWCVCVCGVCVVCVCVCVCAEFPATAASGAQEAGKGQQGKTDSLSIDEQCAECLKRERQIIARVQYNMTAKARELRR